MQIESQAVETAGMLEKFEGSVAALREIERQYGQLQVPPSLFLPAAHACMYHVECFDVEDLGSVSILLPSTSLLPPWPLAPEW